MNYLKPLLSIALTFSIALPCLSELPESLQGSWIIDAEATKTSMKASPKWDASAEKMLPMIFKHLSGMSLTFTKDSMINAMGTQSITVKPEMISSTDGVHVFKATHSERELTFTATINQNGHLNLRADNSDDMDHYLWEKGTLNPDSKNPEIEAALGVMKAALEAETKRKQAEESAALPPFKDTKWRLTINRLDDGTLAAINALEGNGTKYVVILENCPAADFNRIGELPWITRLSISGSKTIDSLEPIAQLVGLKQLQVSRLTASKETPIDLAPLSGLRSLESVDFNGTRVKNTQALAELTSLNKVNVYMSAVNSIDFLTSTPNVEELGLYGFQHTFENYEPLLELPNLKSLNIYMNKQATDEKLLPLQKLTSLETISMSNSREVTTLRFLKNCMAIKSIKASWCKKLTDILDLADKDELRDVGISDCAVEDFTPLKGKQKLRSLDCSKTSFSDLTLLAASTELRSLKINGTPITDISPLATLASLSQLTVSESIPDEQINALQEALPKLRIRKSK